MAGPNRNAIGARMEIRQDGQIRTYERTIGGGHVSGHLLPLHIGLGTGQPAELRITWPGETEPTAWTALPGPGHYVLRHLDLGGTQYSILGTTDPHPCESDSPRRYADYGTCATQAP